MREVLNSISERIRSVSGVALITFATLSLFITFIIYIPVNISNDRVFKVLAVCEIALIFVISISMYRLLKKDFLITKEAAESAYKNNNDAFILDNIASGIIFIDNYGRIKNINKAMCDKLGLEQSAVLYRYVYNIENENKDIDYNIDVLRKAIDLFEQKRDENSLELTYNQNGTVNNSMMISKMVYDNSRNVDGLFIEMIDTTDKEINIERLMQVEKFAVAGQMVAGLTHEIKNSICSMKGLAQMMKKKSSGDSEKYFEVMLDEISHASSLVHNLLSLTKTGTVYENIDLNKLMSDMAPLIESSAYYSGVSINFDIQPDMPKIFGNKAYIRQVIINIVQNAVEELKRNGSLNIRLWLDEKDERIKLEFIDNGPGIRPEYLEKIFEPFFTTKEGGSGLGLAISYEIVKKHHGNMRAYNNENGGATFLIELPISSTEEKYYMVS